MQIKFESVNHVYNANTPMEQRALYDINFEIKEGELVGYIGENGAGKSTTIKMLTGLLTPTSGKVTVNGIIPYKERIKNNDGKNAHPTQKPVKLLEHIIKIASNENDIVLDCFNGVGSTGEACLNLNRRYIGIEIDKEYIDLTKKRLQNIK